MSSTNKLPPAVSGPAPFAFEVDESDASLDNKRWRLKIEHERLTVETWNDARTWHDTLVIERRGPMMRVKLPVQADLTALHATFPAIEHLTPIILAKRRLVEAGAPQDLAPQVIHTKLARALWPIFGRTEPCPASGVASFFDVMAAWAPTLDQYVADPFAK